MSFDEEGGKSIPFCSCYVGLVCVASPPKRSGADVSDTFIRDITPHEINLFAIFTIVVLYVVRLQEGEGRRLAKK